MLSFPLGGRQRSANAQAESASAAALHGDAEAMRRDITREAVVTVTAAAALAEQWGGPLLDRAPALGGNR